jgi:hypothetical protein
MNEHRKSDGPVVPLKSPNNAGQPAVEAMEGSGPAKGNPLKQNAPWTQRQEGAPSALARVRLAAARDRRMRFTALLHHIYDLDTPEFGPFAAVNRKRRGQGKPETFDFLGFTHICGKKRSNGMFTVLRQTIRKRLQAKLSAIKTELKRRLQQPIAEVGQWLRAVVEGHIRYYGVPMNGPALFLFRSRVGWLWHRALARRSQNGRLTWDRMLRLIDRWLPPARVCHPYPVRRLGIIT